MCLITRPYIGATQDLWHNKRALLASNLRLQEFLRHRWQVLFDHKNANAHLRFSVMYSENSLGTSQSETKVFL